MNDFKVTSLGSPFFLIKYFSLTIFFDNCTSFGFSISYLNRIVTIKAKCITRFYLYLMFVCNDEIVQFDTSIYLNRMKRIMILMTYT